MTLGSLFVENKEVKLYPIVGLKGYFLTDDFKVFNKKTNRFLLPFKKFGTKNDYYQFSLENRNKQIQISLPRIVYSAEKGINIMSITSNIIINFKNGVHGFDNFTISDRRELVGKISLQRGKNPANELFYERCHEFTGLILKNETDKIYEFIDKYNHLIISGN